MTLKKLYEGLADIRPRITISYVALSVHVQ